MPHIQHTGRPKSVEPLTERQKDYIANNYQMLSVIQMAQNRHIRAKVIYDYLTEKGWKTPGKLKKSKEPSGDFFDWRDYNNDLAI